MKEKYIETLKSVKNPIINTGYDLKSWQAKAVNIVIRIFGDNSKQEEQINSVKFKSHHVFGTVGGRNSNISPSHIENNAKHCEKQAQELISSFIAEIETFGIPEKKLTPNNGINISLNQNQTVNFNIIWEVVKDELSGKQLKEVDEIIKGNDEPETKRKKITEMLKSFGKDVASNIIAGLLTNPAIYGG